MSKTLLISTIAIQVTFLIFVGAGCAVNQPAVTPSATAVSQLTVPTETAVPPTATTEPTPIVTETAVPPFTQGRIIFWWHPVLIPSESVLQK